MICSVRSRRQGQTIIEFGTIGASVREGEFKASMVPMPYGTGVWQLFNISNDPGEANDLSDQMPEKLASLQAAWTQSCQ